MTETLTQKFRRKTPEAVARVLDDFVRPAMTFEGWGRYDFSNIRLLTTVDEERTGLVGAALNIVGDTQFLKPVEGAPNIVNEDGGRGYVLKLRVQGFDLFENQKGKLSGKPHGLGTYYALAMGLSREEMSDATYVWNGIMRRDVFNPYDRESPTLDNVMSVVPEGKKWPLEQAAALEHLSRLGVLDQVVEDPSYIRSVYAAIGVSSDGRQNARHQEPQGFDHS